MWERVNSILGIEPGDRKVLTLLGPTFAVTTAATVVIASVSKALFLAENELEALPWVFMGSAAFTAFAASIYVQSMRHFGTKKRFPALLAAAAASYAILRLLFPLDPKLMSLLIFVWAPGMGHLVIMQSWTAASTSLPTRQVKRLIPVLAAAATLGAASGGAAVKLSLSWIAAEELLWLASGLLIWNLVRIRRVLAALGETAPDDEEPGVSAITGVEAPEPKGSEVVRGFRNIIQTPLLSRLAVFVFLTQVASILIDYQFSGELQARYDKNEIAGFLGTFYGVSNIVVLLVSLFATSRLVRTLGIGAALSTESTLMAVGSAAYLVAALTGVMPPFFAIAATAFAERIGDFALTRNSVLMLVSPLPTRKAERAKTLIDGVIYRFATILSSVLLLVVASNIEALHAFSPVVIGAGLVVLFLGSRISPHYSRALFEGLRARRLNAATARHLRAGISRRVVRDMEQRIAGAPDTEALRQALGIARELPVPVDNDLLERMGRHADPTVAQLALATLQALERDPSVGLLLHLLRPSNAVELLLAAIDAAKGRPEPELAEGIATLMSHPDVGVSSLALSAGSRGPMPAPVPGAVTSSPGTDIQQSLNSDEPKRRAWAVRATADGGSFDFALFGLPRMLKDPDLGVRLQTVEAMAQIRNPTFVAPLIDALGDAAIRVPVMQALQRFGTKTLPVARTKLADNTLSMVTRTTLLTVVERMADSASVELLREQADGEDLALRDHAVLVLWRMARDRAALRPPDAWLRARAVHETDLLRRLARLEASSVGEDARRTFFRSELDSQRLRAETRVFRLMGMLFNRVALHRAYLYYRSPSRRTRSNAVELIDQHVRDPEMRDVADLVERDEDADGNLCPRSMVGAAAVDAREMERMLEGDAAWLHRVWGWTTGEQGADPELELVLLLKGIPMFADMSGESLLPVAAILEPAKFDKGATIVRVGDEGDRLYLIVKGQVEVIAGGIQVATLGDRECFGELALLDNAPRNATVKALEPVRTLWMSAQDFRDQLDLHPTLARGIIRMLSRRIHQTEQRLGSAVLTQPLTKPPIHEEALHG